MMTDCNATTELPDGQVLVCILEAGPENHPFDCHDDGEHKWGDMTLHSVVEPDVLQEGDGGLDELG
jgi:hypothetical protein